MSALIQINNISKAYGGVQALLDVTFDIGRAECHALCGENGAGKSTLIKVLSGSVRPDSGVVTMDGAPLSLGSVQAAEAAGIAVIHQESIAFPHLGARDNIFVGREPRRLGGILLDRQTMARETRGLLDRLGEHLDIHRPLAELSVAQRQMVGIARALSRRCRLLIMDEPTASLSSRETEVLFRIIRQLLANGVSILYVTHRLDEIFQLSHRVTVLRDGRHVSTTNTSDTDKPALIHMMVGRALVETDSSFRSSASQIDAAPLLQVQSLSRAPAFRDISFTVRPGEIVGLTGLIGAGRSEVARAIFGADRYDSGSVTLCGTPLPPRSIQSSMRRGLAFVPEDRQHLGLVLPMSVGANLSMAVLGSIKRFGLMRNKLETPLVGRMMRDLAVKAASPAVAANTLSGGNQQKLVLGKWLATNPRVLILDEPTRGVDVGAKAEVHRLMRTLADRGMATLLISSDLPEILALSHRILVMRSGRISGELPRDQATQENILALAIPQGAAA